MLYSQSRDRYYVGYTSHAVEVRLQRHNGGWTRSTRAGIPWQLVYYVSFEDKSSAIRWENHIKRQKSRNFIEQLIGSEENEYQE